MPVKGKTCENITYSKIVMITTSTYLDQEGIHLQLADQVYVQCSQEREAFLLLASTHLVSHMVMVYLC